MSPAIGRQPARACGPAAGPSSTRTRTIPISTTRPRSALALDRFDSARYRAAIDRAAEWVIGMQSRNGGWGSFDADNTHYYLNHIPFADHGALLDPPTADVSARCLGFLAQLGYGARSPGGRRGDRLSASASRSPTAAGSAAGAPTTSTAPGRCSPRSTPPGIDAGFARNAARRRLAARAPARRWRLGRRRRILLAGRSRTARRRTAPPSQTAWALLALMAAGEVEQSGGRARHRLSDRQPGRRRQLGRAVVHGGRFPARLLPALSRLPRLFPALGSRPLSPSVARQLAAGALRHLRSHGGTRMCRAASFCP